MADEQEDCGVTEQWTKPGASEALDQNNERRGYSPITVFKIYNLTLVLKKRDGEK